VEMRHENISVSKWKALLETLKSTYRINIENFEAHFQRTLSVAYSTLLVP